MEPGNVLEIFKKHTDIIALPIRIENGNMLYDELSTRWNRYVKMLENTPELKECIPYAKDSIRLLKATIKEYYKGNYTTANKRIKELIQLLTSGNKKSLLITDLESVFIDAESQQWFRGRTWAETLLTSRDMRHIPANMRCNIKNYRYSINGIPCLYICNSIHCCWEELRRPPVDSFWVCRYRPKKPFRVLNLSTTGHEIINAEYFVKCVCEKNVTYDDAVKEFFSNWVLQSACSVVVKKEECVFREEYVIPQLLMQNLKEFGADGIMYFSTRVSFDYSSSSSWVSKNIAIPAFDASGFDGKTGLYSKEIESLFDVSEPINIGYFAKGLYPVSCIIYHESNNSARTKAPVYITNKKAFYSETLFYKCEIELQNYFL